MPKEFQNIKVIPTD